MTTTINIALLALDPEEEKRLRYILRPRSKHPRAKDIEQEITAIENHLARLREIASEEAGTNREGEENASPTERY